MPVNLFRGKKRIPEEHAFKLAMIFKDAPSAIAYLHAFAKTIKSSYPLHDSCLFELPPARNCTFQRWKKIANKGTMMLNPYFREILPHAPVFERMEREGQGRKLNKADIAAKEQEVLAVAKQFKLLAQKPRIVITRNKKNNSRAISGFR